jgi:DNA polymerase III alpha subunit
MVSYHHPTMEPILRETNGVILYQEQFLKLAHSLAGMGLGEAEKLRKDLGKARTPEERTRLGTWFIAGAIERGIDQVQAEKVWEIIAGYTGFGFCKAHACSYALTAYRSAFMKAHYPAEFLAAVVNNQGGYYGPAVYIEDARRLRIALLPPDINLSGMWCEVPPRTRGMRMGLQFVKGLSERAITAIISERRSRGRFHSLFDVMARVSMSPSEVMSLVKVGACDNLGKDASAIDPIKPLAPMEPIAPMASIAGMSGEMGEIVGAIYMPTTPLLTRKQMMWLLPSLMSVRKSGARGAFNRNKAGDLDTGLWLKATGSDNTPYTGTGTGTSPNPSFSMQMVMGDFARISDNSGEGTRILGGDTLRVGIPNVGDYTPSEKLRLEQEVLGFTVSHNMMELYIDTDRLRAQNVVPGTELPKYAERDVAVAGVIVAGRRHMTKAGDWMLFLTLQDAKSLIEVVLFPETYKASEELLAEGGYGPYIVHGQVQVSGKGRGVGVQLPDNLRSADAVTMKMHPTIIASKVISLEDSTRDPML